MHLKNHNKDYITPSVKRLAQSSLDQPSPVTEMPMSTYDLSAVFAITPLLQLRLRQVIAT